MSRSRTVATVTDWWTRLFPRVDELVSDDFYRISGKLRVVVVVVLMVANYGSALTTDYAYEAPQAYWVIQGLIFGLGVLDIALSLWLWRGRLTPAGQQRLTITCGVVDVTIVMIAVHGMGSVNSNMIALAVLIVMFYRLAFTLPVAAAVFAALLLEHWTVVGLELSDGLRSQPMAPGTLDAIYTDAGAHFSQMVVLSAVYGLTFMLAHWSVVRLRHREQAVRILRHALHAGGAGAVGQHTGRVLQDTYSVGPLIAAGGMGEVYRGAHARTGRPLALKLLHPHMIGDARVLQRFRREAEITGRLGSDNIVEVIDVDRAGAQPFIALELLEGESLGECLDRRGRLPLEMVADIVAQTAAGLAVARDAGVVHRDLKPENLFLVDRGADARPLVKILDFGVSKIQGSATAITHEVALLGTPDFMAPEQAVGHADSLDHRTDVFALGAIAYLAITGRRPFAASSIPAVLRAICDTEPVPASALRSSVGPDIDAVLAIAMAKRPSERYTDAQELARDLADAAAGRLAGPVRERAARVHRAAETRHVADAAGASTATADTVNAGLASAATVAGYDPMAGG